MHFERFQKRAGLLALAQQRERSGVVAHVALGKVVGGPFGNGSGRFLAPALYRVEVYGEPEKQ